MTEKNKLWKATVSYEVDVLFVGPEQPSHVDLQEAAWEELEENYDQYNGALGPFTEVTDEKQIPPLWKGSMPYDYGRPDHDPTNKTCLELLKALKKDD